jgi:redox-regulated HSP33 family molecular chaperone
MPNGEAPQPSNRGEAVYLPSLWDEIQTKKSDEAALQKTLGSFMFQLAYTYYLLVFF